MKYKNHHLKIFEVKINTKSEINKLDDILLLQCVILIQ